MFDDWKKRRALKRELREIDKFYESNFRAAKTLEDYLPVRSVYDAETGEILRELSVYETRKMRQRADKWGIDLPPFDSDDDWEKHSWTGHLSLTQAATAKVNRKIGEAKLTYWERWAKILVPILSLLVAILALLVKAGCATATH